MQDSIYSVSNTNAYSLTNITLLIKLHFKVILQFEVEEYDSRMNRFMREWDVDNVITEGWWGQYDVPVYPKYLFI